jgi:carbon starvation protein
VHDFSSLVASLRHGAKSIAEIVRHHLGRRAYLAFLAFLWLSLVYVIIAFTDITAGAFVTPKAPEEGGTIATASLLYLGAGVAMGFAMHKGMSLRAATLLFVPLVGLAIWCSSRMPLVLPVAHPSQAWSLGILAYCFVASLLPVWLLLQPRGHLGGFFLYGVLGGAVAGLCLGAGSFRAEFPAFLSWQHPEGPLFPVLFVTIACGACSGFHGMVCSGTTSKQVEKESHCRPVGYGAMLLEGLVAVIALATVMILTPEAAGKAGGPDRIYAGGIAAFIATLGIPLDFARTFATLAFATFVYDTLDVATRLGRHVVAELLGWQKAWSALAATALTVGVPVAYFLAAPSTLAVGGKDLPAWKLVWTLFGTSNQFLGGLTLLVLTVWLWRERRNPAVTGLPALFILGMTAWSFCLFLRQALAPGAPGVALLNGAVAAVFLLLGAYLGWRVLQAFLSGRETA